MSMSMDLGVGLCVGSSRKHKGRPMVWETHEVGSHQVIKNSQQLEPTKATKVLQLHEITQTMGLLHCLGPKYVFYFQLSFFKNCKIRGET